MLTKRELAVLLLLTQCRKVLIIMPTNDRAKDMQEFLRAQIRAEYPTFCNSYTVTGMVVHIRGHENVTVATPEAAVVFLAGLFESKIINHFKPLLAAEGYDEKGERANDNGRV